MELWKDLFRKSISNTDLYLFGFLTIGPLTAVGRFSRELCLTSPLYLFLWYWSFASLIYFIIISVFLQQAPCTYSNIKKSDIKPEFFVILKIIHGLICVPFVLQILYSCQTSPSSSMWSILGGLFQIVGVQPLRQNFSWKQVTVLFSVSLIY